MNEVQLTARNGMVHHKTPGEFQHAYHGLIEIHPGYVIIKNAVFLVINAGRPSDDWPADVPSDVRNQAKVTAKPVGVDVMIPFGSIHIIHLW